MTRIAPSFAVALAAAAALAPLHARAADSLPAPVVETFDSLDLPAKWTVGPTTWTSSVAVADSPLVWTAFNARRDSLSDADDPAIALQSPNAANKGWILSDPIPSTLQHLSFSCRRIMSSASSPVDFDLYVNGVLLANLRSTNDTSTVLSFDAETVDPETGLPFDAPVTLLVSNRISGANLAIDDIVLTPRTLFVTLDHPGTNEVYAPGEFPGYKNHFDITATPTLPSDFTLPEGAVLYGFWTVTPDFAGDTTPLDSPQLTLIPAAEDAGTTFALTYTATLTLPAPEEEPPEEETPDNPNPTHLKNSGNSTLAFTHSATAFLTVSDAPVPRFLDFEDLPTFDYPTNPVTQTILGHPWQILNARSSQNSDPKRGTRSLRLYHVAASKPAYLASEFAYPSGIGVISFRYANYSDANPSLTLVVQAAPEEAVEPDPDDPDPDPEGWFDLPDATLVVTNHPDIDDYEFRVDAQLDAPHRIRILTTSGVTPGDPARANIDDLAIRPYGSNAPVLVFRGPRAIPALDDWNASFVYLHPDSPGYSWTWSLEGDLPGLAVATNAANDSLDFSLAALPTDTAVRTLTVDVWTNGVKDQQISIPLSVVSYPTFDLEPAADAFTNVVDVYVRNVTLYGTGSNYSVAWSVAPPFTEGSTNSLHNKSRYRVTGISQTNETTHVLTAVLREKSTGLEVSKTVEIVVKPDPALDPDPPGPTPANPPLIVAYAADASSLVVSNLVPGAAYAPFALTNLPVDAFPDPDAFYWTGPAVTLPADASPDDTLPLPLDPPPPLPSPLFFFVASP